MLSTTVKPRSDEQVFLDNFLDKFIGSCVLGTNFIFANEFSCQVLRGLYRSNFRPC